IPGSSASQATVLDGFPLAKKGHAARALSAAFTSSLFGGLFGAPILSFFILIARPLILAFGLPEMLMITILGLSMVAILAGRVPLKGVVAAGAGILFGTIGSAPAGGSLRDIVQDFTADTLAYTVDIQPPESTRAEDRFALSGTLNAFTFLGTGAYPTGGFDVADTSSMLKAGFTFEGSFGHTGGNTHIDITENGQQTIGTFSSDSGLLKMALGASGLSYSGAAQGLTSTMTSSQTPFPVALNAAKSAVALAMPIVPSPETQTYGLTIELSALTTSEKLWSLIDPTAQLPRDPATLHLELSGKAKLLSDILDPAGLTALKTGATKPAELHTLDLNTLKLSLAGAALTGKGAFTFDNSDMETIPGIPRPTGAVDLELAGATTLMDKLVSMGLLDEAQATGARMMLALFAVPAAGEDRLTSKVEVTKDGHLRANGQRLR
uniref:tripartite tricarboxylate transporter permease n=1 Tax=uncultured Lentibacter sp. TaxID=1659309 RepID=UPI0026329E0A